MNTMCVMDIGGTTFRCGLYQDQAITHIEKIPTPNFYRYSTAPEIQRELIRAIIKAFLDKRAVHANITRLGIAFAGPMNNNGEVIASSVIFGQALTQPFPLKQMLEHELKQLGISLETIITTNDITASAWRYCDRGYDPFCLITVSSGIGNKIFAGGQVWIDERGTAGELGHFGIDLPNMTIPCSCGWGVNHIGMIASGRGIENMAKSTGSENGDFRALFLSSALAADPRVNKNHELIKSEWIAEYADRLDLFPQRVIDLCTPALGNAICLLSLAMCLKKFIIIGGFALNCDYYLHSLKRSVMAKGIYNFSAHEIEEMLVLGEKDDDHALLGLGKMLEKN